MLTTVISCWQRAKRRDTLRELREAGLDPTIILSYCCPNGTQAACEAGMRAEASFLDFLGHRVLTSGSSLLEAGRRGNTAAALTACHLALARGQDLLYCEDDITLARDFGAGLALARTQDAAPVWLYTHDATASAASWYHDATLRDLVQARVRGVPVPLRLEPIRDTRRVFATQCVYVPLRVLEGLPLDDAPRARLAFDGWLGRHLHAARKPALVVFPNVVQHKHDRTARSRERTGGKRSLSFDLRRPDAP